jgi:hypothetical protein
MDLDEVINVSWAQFDAIIGEHQPLAPPLLVPPDGHVCGFTCPHVVADDSGSYVCQLTGRIFGKQVMNGPLDARLWESPAYFPGKRKRVQRTFTPAEEVYATCSQTVTKLLDTNERRAADRERLAKALKASTRKAPAAREATPCVLTLMYKMFADVERCGATTVTQRVTEDQQQSLAGLLTSLYSTLVAPFATTDPRRPTGVYYAVAMCYLLSTQSLGRRLHVPMLAAFLPEEKTLKYLGLSVTRMTSAKRYVLAAIKQYVSERKKYRGVP